MDLNDNLNMRVTALETAHQLEVSAIKEDITEIKQGLEKMANDSKARIESERTERKRDRQWTVGSALAAAAVVISAIGLLGGFPH